LKWAVPHMLQYLRKPTKPFMLPSSILLGPQAMLALGNFEADFPLASNMGIVISGTVRPGFTPNVKDC